MEDISAIGRPCQTGRDTHFVLSSLLIRKESGDPQEFAQIFGGNRRDLLFVLRDFSGYLPAKMSNFPLKIPQTSLAGVLIDYAQNRLVGDVEITRFKSVSSVTCFGIKNWRVIFSFSSSIYPESSKVSILSLRAGMIGSARFAVAMNITFERSNGTLR